VSVAGELCQFGNSRADYPDNLASSASLKEKAQDKNTVLSLLLGRWAEFDPKTALNYAQNLLKGMLAIAP
jgi:hypothetical protein